MRETKNNQTGDGTMESILKQFKLKSITRRENQAVWDVESCSGNTYTVNREMHVSRDVGSIYFRYQCDCPAYKKCRHIKAIEDMEYMIASEMAQDGDTDYMDIIECSY